MAKRNKPRSGSLAFSPRKRAKKETPRIHYWADIEKVNLLGFAGYKAGMTNVLAIDNRKNSPTKGLEIFIPVTILDTPPMVVACARAYTAGYFGKNTFTDIWANDPSEDLERRINLPKKRDAEKKLNKLEENLDNLTDIRIILHTQPRMTSLSKKAPDLMEIAIGGTSIKEKFEFVKNVLGKEINMGDVFNDNMFVDVTGVTKGKGFQGVIKRWGTTIQPRKTDKGRRHIGTGGSWTPARKLWVEHMPGQMGYHTRTEYNKIILRIGQDGKEVTPNGGFLYYGPIRKNYTILAGSVPGPAKRLIRLTHARRPAGDTNLEITHINLASKQGE